MWLSFVVLAVNIGLIGYSFWLGHLADAEVPELSFRVDTAVAMAAHDDGFTLPAERECGRIAHAGESLARRYGGA